MERRNLGVAVSRYLEEMAVIVTISKWVANALLEVLSCRMLSLTLVARVRTRTRGSRTRMLLPDSGSL